MLTHIYIKDFAIIQEIDIDLLDNLNIITGETGTGKSIVIQSIDMALGGRGSSSFIAEWAEKAVVQLIFELSDDECKKVSEYISAPEDNLLIISRELNKTGKSTARVNGEIVNLSTLRKITSRLIDIHGQYDNQILLNETNHIDIIDKYGYEKIFPVKNELAKIYDNYDKVRKELAQLKKNHSEFLRKLDFMKFEVEEIETASPFLGEDIELSEHLNVLQNSEKISSVLNEVYEILYNNDLGKCVNLLNSISEYNSNYAQFAESLNDCSYTVDDICTEIRKANDETEFSPTEIDITIERLDLLDKLKRKYGGSIENVLKYKNECLSRLDTFENTKELESDLTERLAKLSAELAARSAQLSTLRRSVGEDLSARMTAELQDLNFADANFAVSVMDKTDTAGNPELSRNGSDEICFLFNANKGGSLKPLVEVVSGGEISRISLAFKRITNDMEHVKVMIFDEIDTGISGITASIVGHKLHRISHNPVSYINSVFQSFTDSGRKR